MPYSLLADSIVLLHFCFVIFVVLGALLALRWRWIITLHIPAAIWGTYIEFSGRICPLTPLENQLRRKAGTENYSSGFIEHYIYPVLYPAGLTREIQLTLGIMVIAINIIIYWYLFKHRNIS